MNEDDVSNNQISRTLESLVNLEYKINFAERSNDALIIIIV